jgi:hypothetical protein
MTTGLMTSPRYAPLIALRWRMCARPGAQGVHRPRALIPVLCLVAAVVGAAARATAPSTYCCWPQRLPDRGAADLLGPLVAGGGQELFPTGQLDAYPVTSRTHS